MEEPKHYKKNALTRGPTPYWLVIRRYWKEWVGIALTWFIYDFITYPVSMHGNYTLLQVAKAFRSSASTPPLSSISRCLWVS